ncbi:MAG: CoA-binding protein [Deltaproteobacteria bacterium]|nr:CoA-binding protein [Deltaproteobacteria bacterium]
MNQIHRTGCKNRVESEETSGYPLTREKMDSEQLKRMESHKLFRLFYPESVALIGVSINTTYGAASFMQALKGFHYPEFGNLYPVNPRYAGKELHGFRCYDSIDSLPEIPDYVLCGLPAKNTPELIDRSIDAGVKFITIFTSGFDETGSSEGKTLHEELVSILNSDKNIDKDGNKRLRVIGPNCLGIYNPSWGLAYFYNQSKQKNGRISIISQSGGQALYLVNFFSNRGHPVRMCVSIGNTIDLDVLDILDFYRVDPFTKAIACYLEGFRSKEGRLMINLIEEISREKPVVIWKTGRMEDSLTAISSHTGALAGDAVIFEAAMNQAGAILTHSMESLFDTTSSLLLSPLPAPVHLKKTVTAPKKVCNKAYNRNGRAQVHDHVEVEGRARPPQLRIGIVVSGGGFSVDMIDTFSSMGLKKAELSPETVKKMGEVLPGINTFIVNPVDIGDQGYHPDVFKKILELCAADENVNFIVTGREVERFAPFGIWLNIDDIAMKYVKAIEEVYLKYQKPVFVVVPHIDIDEKTHAERLKFLKMLRKINVPSFSTVERAAVAASSFKIHMRNRARMDSSGTRTK